jgi:glycine cleavage system transcriptional repressor
VARFSLSALGADRPGIVAAVSGALVDLGCNLEDSSMTILRGQFAILLVLFAPPDVGAGDLEKALAPVAGRFDLTVAVRPVAVEEPARPQEIAGGPTVGGRPQAEEPWTISVHGADHPGIVHAVTSALSDAGGNVVDLATHLVGTADQPLYVLTMRALLPAGELGEQTAERVRLAASQAGVQAIASRDDADVL